MNGYIDIRTQPTTLSHFGPAKARHMVFHDNGILAMTTALPEAQHEVKVKRALYRMRGKETVLAVGMHDRPGKLLAYKGVFDKYGVRITEGFEVDWDNPGEAIASVMKPFLLHMSELSPKWRKWYQDFSTPTIQEQS